MNNDKKNEVKVQQQKHNMKSEKSPQEGTEKYFSVIEWLLEKSIKTINYKSMTRIISKGLWDSKKLDMNWNDD